MTNQSTTFVAIYFPMHLALNIAYLKANLMDEAIILLHFTNEKTLPSINTILFLRSERKGML